jgi:hypothetical protein
METGGIVTTGFNKIFAGYLAHFFYILIDNVALSDPTVPVMDGQSESFQSLEPVQGLMSHPLPFDNENTKTLLGRRKAFRLEAMPSFEVLAFFAGKFLNLGHNTIWDFGLPIAESRNCFSPQSRQGRRENLLLFNPLRGGIE